MNHRFTLISLLFCAILAIAGSAAAASLDVNLFRPYDGNFMFGDPIAYNWRISNGTGLDYNNLFCDLNITDTNAIKTPILHNAHAPDYLDYFKIDANEIIFNADESYDSAIAKLDLSTIVIGYADWGNSGAGTFVIYDINGEVITGPTVFNATETYYISVAALSPTTFAIGYGDFNGDVDIGSFVVYDRDGLEVTAETVFNDRETYPIYVTALDASTIAIAYGDENFVGGETGYQYLGEFVIYDANGEIITEPIIFKDPFSSGWQTAIGITKIDSSTITIAYADGEIAFTTYDKNGEIIIPETTFNDSGSDSMGIAALDSSTIAIAYSDYGNMEYGTFVIYDISGVEITGETIFNSAGQTSYISVAPLTESKIAIGYNDAGNSYFGTFAIYDVNGTMITSPTAFNETETSYISTVAIDSSIIAISYADGTGGVGTFTIYNTDGGWINFEKIFNAYGTDTIAIESLDSSTFVVAYRADNATIGEFDVYDKNGEIITADINFSNYVYAQGLEYGQTIQVKKLDENTFVVLWETDNYPAAYDPHRLNFAVYDKNGTVITPATIVELSTMDGSGFAAFALADINSSRFVVTFAKWEYACSSGTDQGTARIYDRNGAQIGGDIIFTPLCGAGGGRHFSVAALDSSTLVFSFQDNHASGYVGTFNVFDINGTKITDSVTFEPAETRRTRIVVLTPTTFSIAYDVNDLWFGPGRFVTYDKNGDEITPPTYFNTADTQWFSIDKLDNSTLIFGYDDVGNNQYGTYTVYDINGEEIKPEKVFNKASTSEVAVSVFDINTFVFAYPDGGNGSYGTFIVYDINGEPLYGVPDSYGVPPEIGLYSTSDTTATPGVYFTDINCWENGGLFLSDYNRAKGSFIVNALPPDVNELTIQFFDENALTHLNPTTLTLNGTDVTSYLNGDGLLTIPMSSLSNGYYTILAYDATHSQREWTITVDTNSDYDANFGLIATAIGRDIDFQFYKPDTVTKITSTLITARVNDGNTNLIASIISTNTYGQLTFFLSPQEQKYQFQFTFGGTHYDYNEILVTVLIPKDEETLELITPFSVLAGGLTTQSFSGVSDAVTFYALPDTMDYYIVTVDANAAGYWPRMYAFHLPGNPATYTIQPYLVKSANGILTYIYVKNLASKVPIENVLVVVQKDLNASGTAVVASEVTDSAGGTVFSFVYLGHYTLRFYYLGTLVYTATLNPSESLYNVWLDLTSMATTTITEQSSAITFNPSVGNILPDPDDNQFHLSQTISNAYGIISSMNVKVTQGITVLSDTNKTGAYGATFTQDINKDLLTAARQLTVTVTITSSTGTYQHKIAYYVIKAANDPLYQDLTTVALYIGPFGSALIAIILTILMVGALALKTGFGMGGMFFFGILILGLFTYLNFIPLMIFAIAALGGVMAFIAFRGQG